MDRSLFQRLLDWSFFSGQENHPRTGRMEVYGCECQRRRHLPGLKLTPSRGSVVDRMGFDTPVAHAVNDECFFLKLSEKKWNTKTLRLGSKVARLKLKGISCRIDRRWNIAVESKQRETPHHSLNAKNLLWDFLFIFICMLTYRVIENALFS